MNVWFTAAGRLSYFRKKFNIGICPVQGLAKHPINTFVFVVLFVFVFVFDNLQEESLILFLDKKFYIGFAPHANYVSTNWGCFYRKDFWYLAWFEFYFFILFFWFFYLFIGPESDHCLPLSLTDSLFNSLTHSCLVNFIVYLCH